MKNLTKKEVVEKSIFYVLMATMLAVGAYFIVRNAIWLVGDDAACIRHTGWGNYYSLSDYIIPETGRFYPLAFMQYDVLTLLGLSSVTAHFCFHALVMVLMVVMMCILCRMAISSEKLSIWDYTSLISVVAICIARPYRYFLTTEWSIWIDYFTIVLWVFCTYFVHEKQSITAAIGGFLAITYFSYCLEVNSAIPFSYGVVGLLLWKKSTRLEKGYYMSMISTAIIYFILYYILVYTNLGDDIYDASHGENLPLWLVAFKMIFAQKIAWLAIVILCIKAWSLFRQNDSIVWWDNLMIAGFAYFFGCVVMHLHHTVYYWTAVLCMLPAVVYYLHKWIGDKWTMIILLALVFIMCRRFPQVVKENQSDRGKSWELRQVFNDKIIEEGRNVFYYAPVTADENNNEYEWRNQKHDCLPAYIGDAINNHQYTFTAITKFENLPGIYILPCENEKLVPGENDAIIEAGNIVFKGGYGNLTLVEID